MSSMNVTLIKNTRQERTKKNTRKLFARKSFFFYAQTQCIFSLIFILFSFFLAMSAPQNIKENVHIRYIYIFSILIKLFVIKVNRKRKMKMKILTGFSQAAAKNKSFNNIDYILLSLGRMLRMDFCLFSLNTNGQKQFLLLLLFFMAFYVNQEKSLWKRVDDIYYQ